MVYLHDANQISDLNLKSWTLLAPFQFFPSTLKDIAVWSLHFLFEQLMERLMSTVVQWLSSSSSFDSDLNYPFCSTGRPYSPPDPAADAAHSNNTPSSSSPACVGWLFPSPSGPKFSLGCSSSRTHVTIELQLADKRPLICDHQMDVKIQQQVNVVDLSEAPWGTSAGHTVYISVGF